MRNTNVGILLTLLVALSTSLAEANVAGTSQSPLAPLYSRDTSSPQQEWPVATPRGQGDWCKRALVPPLTLPLLQGTL